MSKKPEDVVEQVRAATQRRLPEQLEATGELDPRLRGSFRIRVYVGKEDPEPLAESPDLPLADFEHDQRDASQPLTEATAEGLAKRATAAWGRRKAGG